MNSKESAGFFLVLRIILGISLLLKGIQFVQNNSIIRNVFSESLILQKYLWLQTIIPWMNLLGGVFIIIGMFTRFSAFIQVPILTGAIIFVHSKKGIYEGESNLLFSIIILLLLLVFAFKSPVKPSLDISLRKIKN